MPDFLLQHGALVAHTAASALAALVFALLA